MKVDHYQHRFIESFPRPLDEGVLYVSTRFPCTAHACACGCGREVISNLSPTDWKLIYDGVGVSLRPSIGNWQFPCRSHYWITEGRVEWSSDMTQEEIQAGRDRDRRAKQRYYGSESLTAPQQSLGTNQTPQPNGKSSGWKSRLKRWFGDRG
ncbi:hypothetical protein FHR59_002336 [Xanthomonas arboricola]|uniref:DUF6527 family protein n=1 Tax=Xanthomonas TaxID=338 RepID=UPI001620B4CA|nr:MULTISPECIES: DUF6527 family protein [Xanthomonas]MBB6338073.1 hypothetical protein [Xanthomonas arboricola]CAG2093699.1 hypothetical protein XCY_003004 [Xanthomonas euroxanthea]